MNLEDKPDDTAWDRVLQKVTSAIGRDPTAWTQITTLRPQDLVRQRAHDVMSLVAREPSAMVWDSPLAELLTGELRGFLAEITALPDHGHVAFTGGGTESIFMALFAARERAKARGLDPARMTVVTPTSGHPAIDKAARYLGLGMVRCGLTQDLRCDLDSLERQISAHTVAIVGSLPSDCHGMCDPIPEMAALARERDIWFHVDGAIGGCLVPFLKRVGEGGLPNFGFEVPGVTSATIGLHKYGYAPIGIAALLLRDPAERAFMAVDMTQWDGAGLYGERFDGLKSLDTLAGAWATVRQLGLSGYEERARRIAGNTRDLSACIGAIPGMTLLNRPEAGLVVFGASGPAQAGFAKTFESLGHRGKAIQRPAGFVVCVGPDAGRDDLETYEAAIRHALSLC